MQQATKERQLQAPESMMDENHVHQSASMQTHSQLPPISSESKHVFVNLHVPSCTTLNAIFVVLKQLILPKTAPDLPGQCDETTCRHSRLQRPSSE